MKRIAASFLLAVVLCFVSCGKSYDHGADEAVIKRISDGCGYVSLSTSYNTSFRLNMLFSEDDSTLMFAQGNYSAYFTEKFPDVNAKMTQTILGTSSAVQVSYKDGVCTTTTDGVPADEEMTADEFFGRIIYVKPFIPGSEYIEGIDDISTAAGKGYKVYLKNTEDVLYPLIGDGIYSLAMIKSPQYDLMNIKDANISYTIDENSGEVTTMTMSFTLYIYDTPPYVPNGGKINLEDYTLDIRVDYTVTFL
jgi:hypothetical protein